MQSNNNFLISATRKGSSAGELISSDTYLFPDCPHGPRKKPSLSVLHTRLLEVEGKEDVP